MVEPSEHRATLDNSCWYEVLRQGGGAERGWASLVDSLVRSCAVEVRTVLSEDALQMALAEQKDVVQAFSSVDGQKRPRMDTSKPANGAETPGR